jgi:hypothetical protein
MPYGKGCEFCMANGRKLVFYAIFGVLLSLVSLVLIEMIAEFLMDNSTLLEGNLLSAFHKYYLKDDRVIVQYDPDCAQYDKELFYILKPGQCRIKAREFTVDYRINRAGVRDDETSLQAPRIVVVGDSHAMGWGVDNDSIFSSLLEHKLALPVLNAAVSSYGTARELKMLERFDLSNLEYLVIQYGENDYRENSDYAENGKLSLGSEEKYQSIVEWHRRRIEYYFPKHAYNLMRELGETAASGLHRGLSLWFRDQKYSASHKAKLRKASREVKKNRREAEVFLNVLLASPLDLRDVVVIVFEVNGIASMDSLFIDNVKRHATGREVQSKVKQLQAIDLSPMLVKAHNYFRLDDHLSAVGHLAVAEALEEVILAHGNEATGTGAH